ncbi:MAG: protein kinase [Gammaproteobacteria bacterium]|nr:protein kinase [Gammaproteobacteria bacterium]MBU1442880.1 protein kinase [Gammaproteobacteria bacterium]
MTTLARLRAGQLRGAKRLDLSCGLTEFPREILELGDTLEVLDLSGNELTALPDDLHRLHRLRVLFCSNNRFVELPKVLGRCESLDIVGFKANPIQDVPAESLPSSLRWLILTDNRIEQLPASIGRCSRLQKLMLAGNRLSALPPELAHCERLELLRISANRLDALPAWVTRLPRLAWLAFSGNPFDAEAALSATERPSAPAIRWTELELIRPLGEGASGVIHEALWRRVGDAPMPVAVKVFKGAVTSDGWPRSEMAACMAAGAHPRLIPVIGQLTEHPTLADGLVLGLVDADYVNLAGPPSLQTCTRDVYADELGWNTPTAVRLAQAIASAMAHLHERGVMHGDLYAHNILWNSRGDCLLGDFGAASALPCGGDGAHGLVRALQGLDVRAFGCLLEELVARSTADGEAEQQTLRSMKAIEARCMVPDSLARPRFAEIVSQLDALNAPRDR